MATTTEKKYDISYEDVIITSKAGLSVLPPVHTIENCEVYASSITNSKSKFAKNIRFILPNGDFKAKDRLISNWYTQQIQNGTKDIPGDPNCESHKSPIVQITKADILQGKFPETLEGKWTLNVYTTNMIMYGTKLNKENKPELTKITKMEESIDDKVVYKHYSINDEHSGEAIIPKVFRRNSNGEKITSFISPKNNQEYPLYVQKGDIVNIKIRPFNKKVEATNTYYLKYNVVEIEIIQTAFERGKTGSSNKVNKEATPMDFAGLSSMFAGSVETVATPTVQETKTTPKKAPKAEMPTVESVTGVPGQEPEVTQVQAELPKENAPAISFDFKDLLDNMNNSTLPTNLGE